MPTYQYACTECPHNFEQVQKFSDDALTECPQCHGKLRKVYNAVGVVFKGSGFYRNDSRAADGKGSSSSTSSSSSASEKKSEKKSESTSSSTSSSSSSSSSSTPASTAS
ncbi:FmdB family zinc ribbon protein [Nocardioides sp. GXZ039]|uniref:FmdB family zinc ribbon protein n=1 Tax=Nocardioides sp. GXZ039 TaxID=3136018 RepID=UPI0030F3F04C